MKLNVNPTRMELLKLKRKIKTAERGHKLLKEKRDGLMKQFMAIIREAKSVREKIEQSLGDAFSRFLLATGDLPQQALHEALGWPSKKISLEAETKNVMSVHIPQFTYTEEGDHFCYSLVSTPADIDDALETFSQTVKDMVQLAEIEHSARLLAVEIEKTRRRVNALEHVFIPQMQETIKYISAKLTEQERGALVTLMKVRDLIDAQAAEA